MKILVTTIVFICSLFAFGQTSSDYLESGIIKHKQQDYKGAIKDYTKAIKEDNQSSDAYFNRGICEIALKYYKSAMSDLTKAIEISPDFVKAYYSRATIYVAQEMYKKSLPDLDKVVELDPSIPNALILRGQVRAQVGNKKGACEDFNQAKEMGDQQADKYLSQFCGNKQQDGESLMLDWPESENWKIGSTQENEEMAMIELIHSDETLEDWTEIGTMMSVKRATNIPMDNAMNMMFEQTKMNSPKAKLTFIEKNEEVEYPWIIFSIESPNFKDDKNPESQLWYIVQGKTALYINFRAVKQSAIPLELKEKWIRFFKTGKVIYQ